MADIVQAPEEIVKKFVGFGFKVMFQELQVKPWKNADFTYLGPFVFG